MADYVPSSTLGNALYRTRIAVAASPTFQAMRGVATVEDAFDYVTFEDPRNVDPTNFPHAMILFAEMDQQMIAGGAGPVLFPSGMELTLIVKFYPDETYYDAGDSTNEMQKAQDLGGKIYDEIGGSSINGADITFNGSPIALPSFIGSRCEVYDSEKIGQNDINDGSKTWDYYYLARMDFTVMP